MEDSSDVSKVQVKYQADMMVHYQIYYKAFRALASCQFMHNRTEFLNRFLKTQPTVACLSFTPQVTAVKTLLSSSVI